MRKLFLAAVFCSVVFLSGCIPVFLHPTYSPADVTFNEALIGEWQQKNNTDNAIWQFRAGTENTYLFTHQESDGEVSRPYEVHLFRLGQHMFLDFYPLEKDGTKVADALLIATHFLYRVRFEEGQVILEDFRMDWIKQQISDGQFPLTYVETDSFYLVTSPTEDIQNFLRGQALPTKEAFGEGTVLVRESKVEQGVDNEQTVSPGH